MASRVIWKGAISFGLVHIPVALHTATNDTGIDFDWLDKRSMDPVGYKRINKRTGKEIDKDNIVKGVAYEDDHYVVLTDDEIKAAYPKATQTIEIECFVPLGDIPFVYLDRPYYLAPINKGEKVYALLRETLLKTGRVGVSRVVISSKQHLAALIPAGPALVLNLLRWGNAIRTWDELGLPAPGKKGAGLTDRELSMAEQLVEDMTAKWDPEKFHDSFAEDVMALVHRKVEAGQTKTVIQPEAQEETAAPSNVVNLTELLQRSLRGGKGESSAPARPVAKKATKAAAKTRASPKKRAA